MKKFILLCSGLIVSFSAFAAELDCASSVNGVELKLEKSPSGLILIAVEDPHFDQWDVVINNQNGENVKIRAARFIDTAMVKDLKIEIEKVTPAMQGEILKLAKARIIDTMTGYDKNGDALMTFQQGDDRLDVYCHRPSEKK